MMDVTQVFAKTAHRGLFDNGRGLPENSLAAFARAVAAGYAIELDVRMTADGRLVVHHDEDTARMCGPPGLAVASTALEPLRRLRLLGTAEPIPLLEEVLALVAGQVPLLLELKTTGLPGRAEAALVALLEGYAGPCAIESFSPLTLLWLQRNAPGYVRGLLGEDALRAPGPLAALGGFSVAGRAGAAPQGWTMTPRALARAAAGGAPAAPPPLRLGLWCDFVAYDIDALRPREAEGFRAAGLGLVAWTVRTPGQLAHARALGAGVIFENQEGALDI